jgi:IS5 family transposase
MLRDKYAQDKFFMTIQTLASEMDAELVALDSVLDDDAMVQQVKADMSQRHGRTLRTGRPSSPVEVVLRLLVVKALYNWSYEQTERYVKDSLVLRRFCRIYFEEVPDDTTLIRWAGVLAPKTLEALNERVLVLAHARKLTKGRKLRTDGTVVETNIHYPTDSSLLYDGVRVLSRLLARAKAIVGPVSSLAKTIFRDRTRSAKDMAQQLARSAKRGTQALQGLYQRLVQTAQASLEQAQQVRTWLEPHRSPAAARLCEQLDTYLPRVQQVISQTVRRVFDGEKLPPALKLVSLFEPHTAIIQRGKAGHDTEFGRKVWLSEVDGGFISQYRILHGNPAEEAQWQPSLNHHRHLFGRPPRLASADRGLSSPDNEAYAIQQGVKRVVLPQRGAKDDARRRFEQQAWFRQGRRWQAGIEGRISVLKRKHGLDRCLNHGETGFERWVGWGIFAHNLDHMAHALPRSSING